MQPQASRWRLGQMVNVPALLHLGACMRHPSFLAPHVNADSFINLEPKLLRAKGIKYVVFDKDNTLSRPYETEVHLPFREKLDEFKSVFPEHGALAILSNSAGSADDTNLAEARRVEDATGLPVIQHAVKKPGCAQDVFAFFANRGSNAKMDSLTNNSNNNSSSSSNDNMISPHEICVIGDRILTDVVFANANGMVSVLVPAISTENDNIMAVYIRNIERSLILPLVSWGFKKKGF